MADYAPDLATVDAWGVIHPQSEEFVVPDIPVHAIIPLSPLLALVAPAVGGTILKANVGEINSAVGWNVWSIIWPRSVEVPLCGLIADTYSTSSRCKGPLSHRKRASLRRSIE